MFKKIIIGVLAGLILSGCSVDNSAHLPKVQDAYVKATEAMDSEGMGSFMTGAFMTLVNETDHDVTLVSAKSSIAPMVEIHEVVNGVMQKKEGGIAIKAGETVLLKPGGDHVMLMGMTEPLLPGSEVTITLVFDDESTLEIVAPVKVVNVEQEHYHSAEPTPSMSGI